MKLSVIVPVYCSAATLDRCVESVLIQQVDEMEVILVDDGSPDACPQKCDHWARLDERVSVIHKSNGGLSDARNAGINRATGDYVTFVDSDDFLAPDTYAPLLQLLDARQDVDIVESAVCWHYGSEEQRMLNWEGTYDNGADYWLEARGYEHAFMWNKIFRHALFDNVRFPQGMVFEDVAIMPHLLRRARRIVVTPRGTYYYCVNPLGITSTATGRELRMLLDAHLSIMQDKRMLMDENYYLHVLNIQMDVFEMTGEEPRLPFVRLRLLSTDLPMKMRLKALMLNILGIKRLCKLNKMIHTLMKLRS